MPPGYEQIERSINSGSYSGGPLFLAYSRATPCGLLHTPLKPTILDFLSVRYGQPLDCH